MTTTIVHVPTKRDAQDGIEAAITKLAELRIELIHLAKNLNICGATEDSINGANDHLGDAGAELNDALARIMAQLPLDKAR